MLEVIRTLYTFHQHILDAHLHGIPDQVLKDLVDHSLEGNPCILESEGHHLVAVDSMSSGEVCFLFI